MSTDLSTRAKWVWRSSPASIAAGQISVLAALETLLMVFGYWTLVWYGNWPWLMLVSLLAAPMLLLRSDQSVALGVGWLQTYHNKKDLSKKEKGLLFLGITIVTGLPCYWLALYELPGRIDWVLFLTAAKIGLIASMVVGAVAIALVYSYAYAHENTVAVTVASAHKITGAIAGAGAVIGAVMGAGTGTVAVAVTVALGAVAGSLMGVGMFAVMGVRAVLGTGAGVIADIVAKAGEERQAISNAQKYEIGIFFVSSILFAPLTATFALGMLTRVLLIRLFATLRHPLAGLAQLPNNWHITLWATDLYHSPELLPHAGQVADGFSLPGLWANFRNKRNFDKFIIVFVSPFWYLPGLLYRLSLKASAWLWWPLVLALRPPLAFSPADEKDGDARREASRTIAWHYEIAALSVAILAWVLATALPAAIWQAVLPASLLKLSTLLPAAPSPFSLRALLTYIGFILALLLFIAARGLKAHGGKALENPGDFLSMKGKDKEVFLREAKWILRLRMFLIAVIIAWGYAIVLALAHYYYPQQMARLDWLNWLWPLL